MEKQGGNMTIDIDTRLDEILVKFYNQATKDVYSENNYNGTVYTKAGTKAKQTIKQLMADEFENMIGEDTYDERDDHDTLRRQLRQKLEEWKQ